MHAAARQGSCKFKVTWTDRKSSSSILSGLCCMSQCEVLPCGFGQQQAWTFAAASLCAERPLRRLLCVLACGE
jgi:hypothetical protein